MKKIKTIHEILMALHTIPTTMEGDNPMDRVNNAGMTLYDFTPCSHVITPAFPILPYRFSQIFGPDCNRLRK